MIDVLTNSTERSVKEKDEGWEGPQHEVLGENVGVEVPRLLPMNLE